MSFPNIPDINPSISITFEEAINLLIASIAMEEVSLSKLMDAETNKILCILNNGVHHNCIHDDRMHDAWGHDDGLLYDAIKINKSVDDTIKNMIKLQMLLQFKLDNIKEILPCTSSTTTTSTSTSTTTSTSTSTATCTKTTTTKTTSSSTTTSHTTTCTTSTCSTTTKKEGTCCLAGNGKGCVLNCCDKFHKCPAALYAFVYNHDARERVIRYTVGDDETGLSMYASGYNVKIQSPGQCTDKLVIYGKGYAEQRGTEGSDLAGQASFILTVRRKTAGSLEFRMEIKSKMNPELNHDSGFIQVRDIVSNLRMVACC